MENDLISRSALIEEIEERIADIAFSSPYQNEIESVRDGMQRALDSVENAPAVDAVEVVRCGECAHRVYKEINDCEIGGCELFGVALPCDFYCAEGERRNDV